MSAKICDFGSSTTEYKHTQDLYGTGGWAAPEYLDIRRKNERNEKGDVFSFGVISWELLTKDSPWKEFATSPLDIIVTVTSGERLEIPKHCPEKLRNLMVQCWHNGMNI